MYPNKIAVKLAPPSEHRQVSLWNSKTGSTELNDYNKPLSAHDDLKTSSLRKLREGKMGKSRRNKESLSVIPGKFKDMIFSENGQGILVISLSDSTVTEYVKTWSNRLQEKILNGTGDRLFKCFRDIWLLTGASCSNI